MKKQMVYMILGILLLAVLTIGGTYAFFALSISGGNTINTNSSDFTINYVGGGSTFDGPLNLVSQKEDGYVKTLEISGTVAAKLNLYLVIDQLSSNLAISSFKWEIYGYNTNNVQVYSNSGDFAGKSAANGSNIINLVDYDYTLTSNVTTFKIYLWLDVTGLDNSVFDSTFAGHIEARTEQFTGIVKE